MCVIIYADKVRPSEEMLRKAYTRNGDGAGIAWREPVEDGVVGEDGVVPKQVTWSKGLDLDGLLELAATVPLPFVVHCRIASCGGKHKELTHPFPIEETVPNFLTGTTEGEVLFHNGHWGKWTDVALDLAIRSCTKIPDGKLSDTRMMAFCAAILGNNFINLINEKGIAFGPYTTTFFEGSAGWKYVEGCAVSNDFFMTGYYSADRTGATGGSQAYHGICKFGRCRRHDTDKEGFCPDHTGGKEKSASAPIPPSTAPAPKVLGPSTVPSTGNTTMASPAAPAVAGAAGAKGGASSETPFARWERMNGLFEDGKLSKKAWKRERRKFQKLQPPPGGMTLPA